MNQFLIILFSLASITSVRAETVQVSTQQLQQLLNLADKLAVKNGELARDFGTKEVMPRERDRRDFHRGMGELAADTTEQLERWVERAKTGTNPGPGQGGGNLPDVSLSESFVEDSGYGTYIESEFRKAETAGRALCEAWSKSVSANSAGTIIFAQCGAVEQVKLNNGHVGAKIKGETKISFARLPGLVAAQTMTPLFQASTEYSTYIESEYVKAKTAVLDQCKAWVSNVAGFSKGTLLYLFCGAPELVQGFDGKLWVNVKGNVSYSHKSGKMQATVVSQQFVNTSDYSTYIASEVKKAGDTSQQQCSNWATETVKNSTAIPILVSCSGPEIIKNNKVDVRFTGTIVLLPQ